MVVVLSRPDGGTVPVGVRQGGGQATSGFTFLHFDCPRLDGSGALHLGGS